MVDDPVDHCGGDGLVAEHATPGRERQVRGQDQRGVFVARRHELEHEIRGVLFEGEVADFVDDDQPVAAKPGELGGQLAVAVGFGQSGDPVDGGGEQDPVAVVCSDDRRARWRGGFCRCRVGRAARRCGPR